MSSFEESSAANHTNDGPSAERDIFLQEYKESVASKKMGFRRRFREDKDYRRRLVHTVCHLWAFVGMEWGLQGWAAGQTGAAFPDLRLISRQSLEAASWIFAANSIGNLVGSMLGGYLYDHFSQLAVLVYALLSLAGSTVATPWCTAFPLMVAMRVLSGTGSGCLDTAGNADLMSLWNEEGRAFIQALHFCYGFGGIISPLVTEPFLAKRTCLAVLAGNSSDSQFLNTSIEYQDETNSTSPANVTDCLESYGETRVQYAYLITGAILMSSALPFIVRYIISLQRRRDPQDTEVKKDNKKRPNKLSVLSKLVVLTFLLLLMGITCAVEETFCGFLMTFSLQHLHWTKEQGSYALSLYWLAFTVGRFAGIFLAKRFKPAQMLFAFLVLLVSAYVGFLVASIIVSTNLALVFDALAGLSISVVYPSIVSWTEESILQVTGVIASAFVMANAVALLINPVFLGFLMDNYAPLTFSYLLFAESCVCLLLFLATFCTVRMLVK